MSEYIDAMYRMVRNKFGSRIAESLIDCETVSLVSASPYVKVPLLAGCNVIYDEGFGDIVIRADIVVNGEKLGGQAIYSTRSITESNDASLVISMIFDEMKKQMIDRIAEGDFDLILNK